MQHRTKLTKRTIDRLKSDGHERFYWDTELPGFGLRIRASGRKYFIVQFRAKGRERRMTIGQYSTVTADAARRRAIATSPRRATASTRRPNAMPHARG